MKPASDLWMYRALSRLVWLNYRGKIMLVAFAGTHIPLLTLVIYFTVAHAPDFGYGLRMVGVALASTLAGTGLTLFVLHHLLRPIVLSSRGLREYIEHQDLPELPERYTDEAGTLMADTGQTLQRLDATIHRLSHFDNATALPNRTGFLDRLGQRLTEQRPLAVCALEVVNLNDLVTAFGHARVEGLLRLAARRLEQTVGHSTILARVDDRGLALIAEGNDPQALGDLAGRCLTVLGQRFALDGIEAELLCRAGIAVYAEDGLQAETLLNNALMALAFNTQAQGTTAFFSSAHREALLERHALERDLRRALDEDELVLYYQPVIDGRGDQLIGAEALIRWRHPERGLIPPDRFIPLAEQSGLIEDIGRWTLRTACRQIRDWRGVLPKAASLKIAVNLSARQFADPALADYVAQTMAEFDIPPGALEVELTETSAMAEAERTAEVLGQMQALGVSVAIDDFGTGYSSMSYLRTLPFSKLKIDREFVQNVATNKDHQAICRALIALARELGLEVLAEGTETRSEVDTLLAQGCHTFQGYFFSRPLPPGEFIDRLRVSATKEVADERVA